MRIWAWIASIVVVVGCGTSGPALDAGAATDAALGIDAACGPPPGAICAQSSSICGPGTAIPCGSVCYVCDPLAHSWNPAECDCSDAGPDAAIPDAR